MNSFDQFAHLNASINPFFGQSACVQFYFDSVFSVAMRERSEHGRVKPITGKSFSRFTIRSSFPF